jgi:hypothetical protein
MNLTIPLKKYLYRYVQKTFGLQAQQLLDLPFLAVPTIQNTDTIGGYFRKAEREFKDYFKITLTRGKPSKEYKYAVVKYLEWCFNTTYLAYMEAIKLQGKNQREAIENFCNYYNIDLDDDITLACLRKKTQRHSKGVHRKNLFHKENTPLTILPHTVQSILTAELLVA